MADNSKARSSSGFTLIEVLITIVILAVGLLGLALLQSTSLANQLEAYQRAQAMLILEDMANRVRVNSINARTGAYPDSDQYGLLDEEDCTAMSVVADRDLCDWNKAVAGTGVKLDSNNLGSLVGARACIENVAGSADGEAILRLTIAWQGMVETAAPQSVCGQGAFGDDDRLRRVASIDAVLADLSL